jgi:tetratricopeptide (TPR) repeat protein
MLMADYIFSEDTSIKKKYKMNQFLLGVGIVLVGVYIAMRWITPPANNHYGNNWYPLGFDSYRFHRTSSTFWMSFIPIPDFSNIHFWNSSLLYTDTSTFTSKALFLLSLCIFLFCIINYSQKISVAVLYLAGTLGVLLFHYMNSVIFSINAANHYGFIFITFIVAAWIAPNVKKTKIVIPALSSLRNKLKTDKNFTYLVTALFAINMLAGLIAYSKDYSHPFSNIEATGNYITSHHLDKLPETGFIDYAVSPISAFTKQPMYFPDRDTTGRFTISIQSRYSFDLKVLFPRLANFISHQKDSVLYISTGDYFGVGDAKVIDNIQFTKIAYFDGAIVPDENYVIYIARKFDLNKMMQDSASYKNSSTLASILSVANDLIQNGKLDDAGKILSTVEEKTHGRSVPYLHDYFGKLYAKENKQADAEKEFQTEIALNLQKEDAFFNLGMLYFQNKDYDKAITSWDSTVAINPKNADAYNNMGVCYLNFKKDNTKGMTYFEKAIELNPGYTQGYFNILVCAQNNNDEQTMIKYIRVLLDKGTTIDDIKAKGINITDALLQKVNAR